MKLTGRVSTVFFAVTLLAAGVDAAQPAAADNGNNQLPELDCIIEPSEMVDVGSAVPGVVEAILADRNDQIAKGTVIAQLESGVERATLELTRERANLNTAIELRQEGARFGNLTQKRNKSLLQTAAISKHEVDAVVSETRIAELQVRQELDNKRIAGLELQRAEAALDRRTIRSPVDGVVVDRFKAVGEYVDDEPVMRVAQLDPLHVEVILSTDYLGRIEPGMRAQVTPVIPEADTYLATVERVDRVSDAASGTYGVRLNLANPGYMIPAGLRCRLGFVPVDQTESVEISGDAGVTTNDSGAPEEEAPDNIRPEPQNFANARQPGESRDPERLPGNRMTSSNPLDSGITGSDSDQLAVAAVPGQPADSIASEQVDTPAEERLDSTEEVPVQTVAAVSETLAVSKLPEKSVAAVEIPEVAAAAVSVQPGTPDSEAPPVSEEAEPGSCHTVGPFTREKVAQRWLEGLQEVAEHLALRNEPHSVAGDFIVLAAVEPNPNAVESLLDRLDRAGITDRYHFRSGVRKGSVSLGLYSNHGMAVKRQEELAAKGFAAEVTPRSITNKQSWWLDLALPAGAALPKWISQLPANASAKPVICPAQLAQR